MPMMPGPGVSRDSNPVVNEQIDVPGAWEEIDLSDLRGVILVVGAPDAGKSTFVHYLFRRLSEAGHSVAYLDGDPGQSSLGPPATMTAVLQDGPSLPAPGYFPQEGKMWRSFVGAVSPAGHMLPMVVSAARLVKAALQAGAGVVLYDTCGLIDPPAGGLALKMAKIDLLKPAIVFAIQRDRELEALLTPVRLSGRARVVDLRPSPAARRRAHPARQAHRAARFARYFAGARLLRVDWSRLAVFPSPRFALNRLVALEDEQGFTLGLGVVRDIDREARRLTLYTPLGDMKHVTAIHIGDVEVDVATFRDKTIGRG